MKEKTDPWELTGASSKSLGQTVWLVFGSVGTIGPCIISKISYTDYGKVLYDVKAWPFPTEKDNTDIATTISNIDSYFVKSEAEMILETKSKI